MDKVKLSSIPAGHDGNGYITLDGGVVAAFRIAKISAQLDVTKESRRFLGEVMTQNAARGMAGSGNVSYYHTTTALIDAMKKYQNGDSYPELTLQYYAEAPGSKGRCEVVLRNVVLDAVSFGALDDSSDDAMMNESAFSFDDFDIIERF
ncbi:phage tail tube protein [Oscillospiraceae bacterium LTW-04]|nr:phage tail tube protein [Oscillospiraceae bacterium MB24-C1]